MQKVLSVEILPQVLRADVKRTGGSNEATVYLNSEPLCIDFHLALRLPQCRQAVAAILPSLLMLHLCLFLAESLLLFLRRGAVRPRGTEIEASTSSIFAPLLSLQDSRAESEDG